MFVKVGSDFNQKVLQVETSSRESAELCHASGAVCGKKSRREATNWDGMGKEKRADLSRTKGLVPIFWTNVLIW